jgi:hypothetical protein
MGKPPQKASVYRGHSCARRGWPLAVRERGTCITSQRGAETLYATCKLLACHSSRVFGDASSYSGRGRDRRKPQRAGLPYWRARPAFPCSSARATRCRHRAFCRVIELPRAEMRRKMKSVRVF